MKFLGIKIEKSLPTKLLLEEAEGILEQSENILAEPSRNKFQKS